MLQFHSGVSHISHYSRHNTHSHQHTYTHGHIHYTHTHTHAHTHTHQHTHTHTFLWWPFPPLLPLSLHFLSEILHKPGFTEGKCTHQTIPLINNETGLVICCIASQPTIQLSLVTTCIVQALYCGYLRGPGEGSCIERFPHFSGKFL